ncbi:efflux RND transporter periplasmic adaptor subunit [Xanthomonas campestris pv. raphani]|uniref:efflux RND transporter periplasmic adaptor subunit n=1 Tax=Xanthomonas campestris TaxID=339 RepID=UPI000E32B7EE|nr:efflux RND transporter periplasmic adaptor subunit [Xanthomonas campestris]MCC5068533.1 efflux RND transporter periplasmic adaptor subunit [Xanthomonas campestris]MCC5085120.1 efflux RND transporter periplasmic adaptor subunit [Xanthomonas campestris]MEA9787637.1 efflux RND transporter periplasmic adaptor subunit [Xanthomonas campestris pv. raphani]MEA9842572.1 efflux RND transporter periplasmic adaptor subunit [Xanthomonas campestris pv. raphani]RFF69259.1 efflux RND transporter periplasmi
MRPVPSLRLPLLAVAASVLISACGSPPGGPPPQQGTPVVGVITVRPQPVTLTTQLPGRTVPYLIAEVRPQVGGIVQTRQFTEGGDVKAGQTLYQIDPATYRASYASAQATLAKAQANLRTARLKADRYKELVQIKAISQQEGDDTAATLGQAEADVAAGKASVETARINLAFARMDAPISGRIGRSSVTPGALVTANQATALTTIQQLDPIYVDVTQPSAAVLRLKKAMARGDLARAGDDAAQVSLVLEDGSTYPLQGRLAFSDVTVDQNTGSISLRAVFPNPDADLLPGMYVRAVLQEGVKAQGVLVPQQAVTRNGAGKPTAFVVGADNKLQLRVLETDRAVGDQWLVRSGLKTGDQLVVDGLSRARDGVQVKTVPWQPTSASVAGSPSAPAAPRAAN